MNHNEYNDKMKTSMYILEKFFLYIISLGKLIIQFNWFNWFFFEIPRQSEQGYNDGKVSTV